MPSINLIKMAKAIIMYHANMVELIDAAWVLNLINDDKCDKLKGKHLMAVIGLLDKLGIDWSK